MRLAYDRPNKTYQFVSRNGFGHDIFSTNAIIPLPDFMGGGYSGEEHYWDVLSFLGCPDLLGNFWARKIWHDDIEQNNVWLKLFGAFSSRGCI